MRVESIDVIGRATLDQLEHRLRDRGYRLADGPLVPGRYTWLASDGAPGWADWTYELTLALLDGDDVHELLATPQGPPDSTT